MSQRRNEISFRLQLRGGGGTGSLWLAIPVEVGGAFTLAMVPNSVAARSVINPDAFATLQSLGLVGATVHRLETGGQHCILSRLTIVDRAVDDLEVQVRDVP